MSKQLSPRAYEHAAWFLGSDVAAIQAVAEVEAAGSGFLATGEPRILYEAHKFHEFTRGAYDGKLFVNLGNFPYEQRLMSTSNWIRDSYGPESLQHRKLAQASGLNRSAALMSCSWGLFQILGENFKRAGFTTIQDFVNAAYEGEDAHLRMFVHFIESDPKLHVALNSHDWTTFEQRYNGGGFKGAYATKMLAVYERIRSAKP